MNHLSVGCEMSLKRINRMREKIINGPLGTKVLVYCLLFVGGFLAMIVIPRYVLDLPDWLKDFLFIFFWVAFGTRAVFFFMP